MKLREHTNCKRQVLSFEAGDDEQEVRLLKIINEALQMHPEGKKLVVDLDGDSLSLNYPPIKVVE